MADITNPKLLYLKGLLFLIVGLLAAALLFVESPTWPTAILIAIAIWSFCRLYYFMFYVIEHYVDPGYRFAGIFDFLKYAWRRRKVARPVSLDNQPKPPRGEQS